MNQAVASSSPPPRGSPFVRVMDAVPGRYRRRRHRSLSYSISAMGSFSWFSPAAGLESASLVVSVGGPEGASVGASVGELEGASLGVVDGTKDGTEDDIVGASDAVGVEEGMSK